MRLAGIVVAIFVAAQARAAVFDLHDLGPLTSSKSITVGGITLSLQSSPGILTSSASTFGIDGTGANDAANLIDGGNGAAEKITFIFNPQVVIDSIAISQFDPTDAGTVDVKGAGTLALHDGVNTINLTAGATSANFLQYTGPLTSGVTNGFSLDSITVHTTPEPSSALAVGALATLFTRRRRTLAKTAR
jgi:hypothetical protein